MPATSQDDMLKHLNISSDLTQTLHQAEEREGEEPIEKSDKKKDHEGQEKHKIERDIFSFSQSFSLPPSLTVSMTIEGGFIGYSGGNMMRP